MRTSSCFALLVLLAVPPGCTPKETGSPEETGEPSETESEIESESEASDADGDGFTADGGDCDDTNPVINPAATDIVGDETDQNCDGVDGIDADGDTFASVVSGGSDCDDGAPATYPGASDTVGDGVDQDCDGLDGVDGDGDGYASVGSGGDDCDDAEASAYPGAADTVGDGLDQSCDGVDGIDADGDTFASMGSGGSDCDDGAPATYPGASDTVGDGVDQGCDGLDGVDGDGDGYASVGSGGDDCDDADALLDPADRDADGSSTCAGDCDDADAARAPGLVDLCDGTDEDCVAGVDTTALGDVCLRDEVFEIGSSALDLVLVVDDSCSMSEKQTRLALSADELIDALSGVDLHVGVVTTDMDDAARSGRFVRGPDRSLYLADTSDPVGAAAWLADTVQVGTGGSGSEQPFDAAYEAIEVLGPTFHAGFLRPGAELGFVFVTDEADFSSLSGVAFFDWATSLSVPRVSAHAFASPAMDCGLDWISASTEVAWVVSELGGTFVSICESDWQDEASVIGADLSPGVSTEIVLAEEPDPATIVATLTEPAGSPVLLVAGVDYSYDASGWRIVLAVPPAAGSVVEVAYRAVPTP